MISPEERLRLRGLNRNDMAYWRGLKRRGQVIVDEINQRFHSHAARLSPNYAVMLDVTTAEVLMGHD